MENSLYEHRFVTHTIEDAMAAVHLAANSLAIRPSFSAKGDICKKRECLVQTTRIGIGSLVSEMFGAVIVDPRQIAPRSGTELDFSHVERGARR